MMRPWSEHQDLVGALDRAQARGDDEGGAPAHHGVERLLDQILGLHIHAGGGVVEDQDARVEQEGAGDGDALLLAAGERDAALADPGVVAVGEAADEVVERGRPWRRR